MFIANTLIKSQNDSLIEKNQTKLPQFNLNGCLLFESMNYKDCLKSGGYQLNSKTDLNNDLRNIVLNIPYPFIGKWYLALWKECIDRDTKYIYYYYYLYR